MRGLSQPLRDSDCVRDHVCTAAERRPPPLRPCWVFVGSTLRDLVEYRSPYMYGAAHSVRIRPGFVPHDAPAGAGRPPVRARGRARAAHTTEIQIEIYTPLRGCRCRVRARYRINVDRFYTCGLDNVGTREPNGFYMCECVSWCVLCIRFVSVPARGSPPLCERTCECAEPALENPVAVRGDAVCTARSTLVDRHSVYTLIRLGVARWGPKWGVSER